MSNQFSRITHPKEDLGTQNDSDFIDFAYSETCFLFALLSIQVSVPLQLSSLNAF